MEIKLDNSAETKVCCYCGKSKTLDNYYKQPRMKDGLMRLCKKCKLMGLTCLNKLKASGPKRNLSKELELNLKNVKKEDWIQMYTLLQNLGYNISDDVSVHSQFCEKHNLPKKSRNDKKMKIYSPKDLGII